eukprot:1160470-Pelagomonas_calceolata.AAC.2
MEPPGKRHWRVKEEDQRTRKHASAEASRPGGFAKVTGRRNAVIPSSLLNFESVDAKAKTGRCARCVRADPGLEDDQQRIVSSKLPCLRSCVVPNLVKNAYESKDCAW